MFTDSQGAEIVTGNIKDACILHDYLQPKKKLLVVVVFHFGVVAEDADI